MRRHLASSFSHSTVGINLFSCSRCVSCSRFSFSLSAALAWALYSPTTTTTRATTRATRALPLRLDVSLESTLQCLSPLVVSLNCPKPRVLSNEFVRRSSRPAPRTEEEHHGPSTMSLVSTRQRDDDKGGSFCAARFLQVLVVHLFSFIIIFFLPFFSLVFFLCPPSVRPSPSILSSKESEIEKDADVQTKNNNCETFDI